MFIPWQKDGRHESAGRLLCFWIDPDGDRVPAGFSFLGINTCSHRCSGRDRCGGPCWSYRSHGPCRPCWRGRRSRCYRPCWSYRSHGPCWRGRRSRCCGPRWSHWSYRTYWSRRCHRCHRCYWRHRSHWPRRSHWSYWPDGCYRPCRCGAGSGGRCGGYPDAGDSHPGGDRHPVQHPAGQPAGGRPAVHVMKTKSLSQNWERLRLSETDEREQSPVRAK